MPMLFAIVFTAGSITHIFAPMLITDADDLFRIPANSDVISIISSTENVMPMVSAVNFALSFTSSLNARRRMPFMMGREPGTSAS
ncbi:hypothetical protein LMG29660_03419 [Burkholderia puraquae]|uniref:Uncharacterized protein n=1 Tax=Burkholderia puraquae TaxID=1904757 RepID=A0A6J5DW20_9BURK|nr:hypothetical protein LMG29660_03419 [Burkholderia puraquae]